ncbi:MAG: ABC transporter ATP-binding protein, partial [Leptonema sp. (in: Bacteria)]|nr:ABC transporter ATP-binding protein [Leptonema sp. (in: bacteria)]
LVRLFFLLVSVRLIAGTGYMAIRDLRRELYQKMHALPLYHFYREKTGYLMSRLIHDVELVAAVVSSNMRDSITNIFFLITHVLFLLYLNYKLLFISILTVPLILSPVSLFSRKINSSTRRSQDLLAEMSGVLQEDISGVRTVRSFAVEKWMNERFSAKNQRYTWRSFKELFYIRMGPNLVELTSSLVTVGIIGLGAFFMDGANFTGGEFFTFLLTLLFIIRPIIQLSGMFAKVAQAEAAGERIFELLDAESDVSDSPNPVIKHKMAQGIQYYNVSFKYPKTDKEVLNNVNFEVKAGQTVALVGESGAGKSTLMDLMSRFFDPTSGEIRIDGIDIRNFTVHDHRSRIGIVQQENFLFHGTIQENICYGRPNFTIRDAERAARLANAHDFIERFPEGYNTIVGERGVMLSGGQRQRISIARALLYDPEILILDEATSALDTESEQLVQKALNRLFKNRTTFVIAHRLSTIEKADLILVVSAGTIVDRGTHSELMSREGLYSRLQQISREAMG